MVEVVLFTQETCGACATQRQENEGIEDVFPDVEFREVDIQRDLETAKEYGVRKTPTTLVYAGGERVEEFIGIVELAELEATIRSAESGNRNGIGDRIVSFLRR